MTTKIGWASDGNATLDDIDVEMTHAERMVAVYSIRHFSTGGHPLPTEKNIGEFSAKFVLGMLGRAIKDQCASDLDEAAALKSARIKIAKKVA